MAIRTIEIYGRSISVPNDENLQRELRHLNHSNDNETNERGETNAEIIDFNDARESYYSTSPFSVDDLPRLVSNAYVNAGLISDRQGAAIEQAYYLTKDLEELNRYAREWAEQDQDNDEDILKIDTWRSLGFYLMTDSVCDIFDDNRGILADITPYDLECLSFDVNEANFETFGMVLAARLYMIAALISDKDIGDLPIFGRNEECPEIDVMLEDIPNELVVLMNELDSLYQETYSYLGNVDLIENSEDSCSWMNEIGWLFGECPRHQIFIPKFTINYSQKTEPASVPWSPYISSIAELSPEDIIKE